MNKSWKKRKEELIKKLQSERIDTVLRAYGIISKGEDENGYWYKYADGTMLAQAKDPKKTAIINNGVITWKSLF
jgi:hypothetical protein